MTRLQQARAAALDAYGPVKPRLPDHLFVCQLMISGYHDQAANLKAALLAQGEL